MMHLVIALNRYTAFFYPMEHSHIWRCRMVGGSIAGVAVLSVMLHVVPLYILPLFFRLEWDVMLGLQFNVRLH